MKRLLFTLLAFLFLSSNCHATITTYHATISAQLSSGAGFNQLASVHRSDPGGSVSTATTARAAWNSSSDAGQDDKYNGMNRSMMFFNTASIPDADEISAAVFSLYANVNGLEQLGPAYLGVVSANPTSTSSFVAADYAVSRYGTTDFITRVRANAWTLGHYEDMPLNASGIANIDKTGITKFGTRFGWDIDNNLVWTWDNAKTVTFPYNGASIGGTQFDPKLVVTHDAPAPDFTPQLIIF